MVEKLHFGNYVVLKQLAQDFIENHRSPLGDIKRGSILKTADGISYDIDISKPVTKKINYGQFVGECTI